MKKSIVIIGAGGHGRVVSDTAFLCGYQEVLFLDDAEKCEVALSGKSNDYKKFVETSDFFVAIGNNAVRKRMIKDLQSNGAEVVTLIHPSSIIGSRVVIGQGTFVAPGVVINTGAVIGEGVILNTSCSVDHDCRVDSFSHISVGSHLAGTVTVGEETFVGVGASVKNNVSICEGCMIGAGAVVVKNILEKGTYVGVPAVKIKK